MNKFYRIRRFLRFVCLATFVTSLVSAATPDANAGVAEVGVENANQTPTANLPNLPNLADLPGIIADQLAAGQKQVVIPPGRYRVTPHNREHLRFEGLRDVNILAHGVELICTETTRAITIVDCQNLTIRGLTIDYDPLPFTQGRIVEQNGHQNFTFEVIDGYPSTGVSPRGKVEVFDPATDRLRSHTLFNTKIQPLNDGRFRIQRPQRFQRDLGEFEPRMGDTVVVSAKHAPGGSIPHAIMATGSNGLRFEDVTLYAANMFGFFERRCSGSVYRRCRVERRPQADDPVSRAHPRVRSLNADAFHSKHADVGPQYLDCVATHQSDDAFAINGDYHLVAESTGAELRVLAKHDREFYLAPGDPVELVTYQGVRLPDAAVVSVEPDGEITADERAFLTDQRMDARLKNTRNMLNKAYRVTLDRPVSLSRGAVLGALNRMGNGFRIEGCKLGHNRSRGVLAKASHGVIANNTIQGCWGEAILVAPEWWWLESGSSIDVVIANNTIADVRGIAIAVFALGGNGQIAPAGAHKDIVIRGNRIENTPSPGIYISSTLGLTSENNKVKSHSNRKLLPWVASKYQLDGNPGQTVLIHTESN